MRRSRFSYRMLFLVGIAILLLSLVVTGWTWSGVGAASSFASPAFQQQWNSVESVIPNFWGPLSTARDGQAEPYVEGSYNGQSGMRLVQYFDKARMEQTTPSSPVTNGLLAVELKSGQLQLGDNSFEQRAAANIGLAGDPNTPGPTYAALAQLPEKSPQAAGAVNMGYDVASNTFTTTPPATDPALTYGAYISDPGGRFGQNVPQAFVTFLNSIPGGYLTSMGYPISPAFAASVQVAGKPNVSVVIQAFQRKVLTYTVSNPAAFQVEFGNIGQHYYTWRYSGTPAPGPTPAPTTPSGTPTPSLVGPVWQWQQTQLNDGSVTTVKDPSRYTLTFMANGAVAIKADCNQIVGSYQTMNGQLTITLGPATLAACPPDSQADTFVLQLTNVSGYVMSGNALILNLKFDSGGMRFVPLTNASLVGPSWTARGYNNGKGGFTTPLSGTQLTIQFGADGTVSGKSGCNTFTGPYQTSGASLTIGPLATTRIACTPEIMDQEQAFLAALAATKSYRIIGTTLTLSDATGTRMAEFAAS